MAAPQDEIAVLRRFVALQLAPPPDAPPPADVHTAVALALLLDDAPVQDLAHFCRYDLPRLLQHLSRRTQGTRTTLHGRVRGRIEWPATVKARLSGEYDPMRFVCREVRHQFDTPENQLLVALLDLLDAAHAAVPAWLRDGTSIAGAGEEAPATHRRLAELRVSMQRARRNVYLRQVTPPAVVTDAQRRRAAQADVPEYGRVLALHTHMHGYLRRPEHPAAHAYAAAVFRRTLPLPAALTPRTEAWLQMLVRMLEQAA